MAKATLELLTEMLRAAKLAGIEAGKNTEDGGTCNLDSPAFRVERARDALLKEAAIAAGVTIYEFSWFGGRRRLPGCTGPAPQTSAGHVDLPGVDGPCRRMDRQHPDARRPVDGHVRRSDGCRAHPLPNLHPEGGPQMRLAAQVKGGYYPAAPEAVTLIGRLIEYRGGAILDPCAGQGEAIDTLATSMGVPRAKVYAIELERDRAEATRARLEGANVMLPCSFFDAKINSGSIAVAYVNPPFDTNVHGGRAEVDFLMRATHLLQPGGIILYVVPAYVVESAYATSVAYLLQHSVAYLLQHFDQLAVLTFPPDFRPYEEVVVIGVKRRTTVPHDYDMWQRNVPKRKLADCTIRWQGPDKDIAPRLFEKGGLTDDELREALAASPLWKVTGIPEERQSARPPLPLSRGHIALLLASGQLDGVVAPANEQSHVVRGTATKVQCDPSVTQEVQDSGAVKTVMVLRERIQLVVRAVGPDGVIRTFQ